MLSSSLSLEIMKYTPSSHVKKILSKINWFIMKNIHLLQIGYCHSEGCMYKYKVKAYINKGKGVVIHSNIGR